MSLETLRAVHLGSVVAAQGVDLLPAGHGRLRGLCPFHQERTPSFFIFLEKQRFHCFGCGEGGDAIDFVRRIHGFGFREALSFLRIQRPQPTSQALQKKARLKAERLGYERRERELAWTIGTAIRRCHKALRKLIRENFDSPGMALILTELETLQYQHDILIYGCPADRTELVRELAGLRLFDRELLFCRNFDFAGWIRSISWTKK